VYTVKKDFVELEPVTSTVNVPGAMNQRPVDVGVSPRFVPLGAITAVICQPAGTINVTMLPNDDSLVTPIVAVRTGGGVGVELGGVDGRDDGVGLSVGWVVVAVGGLVGLVAGGGAGTLPAPGDVGVGPDGAVRGCVGLVFGFDGTVVFGFDVPGAVDEPGTTGADTLTDSFWVSAAAGAPPW
jgi:hypothetical protein